MDIADEAVPLAEAPVEIADEEVPLAEAPVEILDEDVPLADIADEAVPLADVPETGDSVQPWGMTALAAIAGLFHLGKRKKEEEA